MLGTNTMATFRSSPLHWVLSDSKYHNSIGSYMLWGNSGKICFHLLIHALFPIPEQNSLSSLFSTSLCSLFLISYFPPLFPTSTSHSIKWRTEVLESYKYIFQHEVENGSKNSILPSVAKMHVRANEIILFRVGEYQK